MIPVHKPERREDGMICDSYPDDGEPYRQFLCRTWKPFLPVAHLSCLNPSTAGRLVDDPTVRHAVAILDWLGYGTMLLTNQFDARATDPKGLLSMAVPVTPENNRWIVDCLNCAELTIMAYGSQPKLDWRFREVRKLRQLGFKAAYVAQNGLEAIPEDGGPAWGDFDALFIGGDNAYKLSEAAYQLARRAKSHGKHVHMGRVNSLRRLRAAHISAFDSADGTYLKFGPDVNIGRLYGWLDGINGQQPLELTA